MPVVSLGCCVARHCAKFSRNLKHSRVNPVPKLEEEEEDLLKNEVAMLIIYLY
jgi:hypothetical protein